MKVQLEVFLTSVHLRILTLNSSSSQSTNKNKLAIDTAKEELALESLLEFCREPSLMQDLYTNYDCDVQCTNLFDSIISILCIRAIPHGLHISSYKNYKENNMDSNVNKNSNNLLNNIKISILNKLALDGVFAVLHSVAMKCADTNKVVKTSKKIISIKDSDISTDTSVHSEFMYEFNPNNSNLSSPVEKEKLNGSDKVDNVDTLVDQWCLEDLETKHEKKSSGDLSGDAMNVGGGREGKILTLNDITNKNIDHNDSKKVGDDHENNNDKYSSNNHENINDISIDSNENYEMLKNIDSREISSSPFSANTSIDGRNGSDVCDNDDIDFYILARSKTTEILRQRKLKKQRLHLAAEKFNEKPLKADWIHFSLGLIFFFLLRNCFILYFRLFYHLFAIL